MLIPHLEIVLDLDRIKRDLKAHGRAAGIYYSNGSCWWSHYRSHAYVSGRDMKCPLGGQIFLETDWEAWFDAAHENPSYYGQHGLLALMAAHHSNCRHPETGGHFAAPNWRPYNAALDVLLAEEGALG